MSYGQNFNIIRHFSLMDNIILFGKSGDMYFICIITKILNPPKKPNYSQSEACIYIKHNDNTYYNIQVTLLPYKNKLNKQINELFMDFLKQFGKEIYKNLKKNSEDMKIKEKNNEFLYFLYDIPAYIWCTAVGMISAKL